MTCVVALRDEGNVYMGADSAGVAHYSLQVRRDPKIYRVGKMLIGFTSSFRMGQLLGYSLTPPDHHSDVSIEKYMNTAFVDAVRACLKAGGYAKTENAVDSGGQFLIAYQNRIFEVDSDFQVGERQEDYAAVGCGSELALGSLFTSAFWTRAANDRVMQALEAAERFSAGVRGPFHIEVLNK